MSNDIISRIQQFIELKHLSSNAFAKEIGVDPSNLNKMLAGKQKITEKTIGKIGKTFLELNLDWLKTGEGVIILRNPENNAVLLGNPVAEIKENLVDVKFYEVTPSATFKDYCQGMSENPSRISIIPIKGECIDETSCVFEIHGDSMAPQIQNGALVLCREIPPTRWHTLNDCVVVIAYGDKFVIKRIIKNRLDGENYIILASDNPDNQKSLSDCVALKDIRCIFTAERIISQRIS